MATFTLGHAIPRRDATTLFRYLLCRASLMRQRRALAQLDAERLDDIGLSADAARKEAARPIWDAPAYWRH